MITFGFSLAAFVLCLAAANKSLRHGILALMGVGYVYGILRANYPDVGTYLAFDAAVLGLYIGQLWRPMTPPQRRRSHDLRLWLTVLIAWPVLLFIAFPSDSLLVELVGLRANIFLLPLMFLGTRLSEDDMFNLAIGLAALNVAAVLLGVAEFFMGIAKFYPLNEVTEIIYRSKDVMGQTAHRIPASFSSAHAFAGTMVLTLPLLVGAWVQTTRTTKGQRSFIGIAIVASLLGIFMAAARTHMITAALLVVIVTFSGYLRRDQWLRWIAVIGLVGYVVYGQERLQRFTTLQDAGFISERWTGSVNENFFEAVRSYPLGNGLAGGGTSVPYFLRGTQSPLVMENEYARIALEQGLPGLAIWCTFLLYVFVRWPSRKVDGWGFGRQLGWITCGVFFFSALTGIGLLSSVPQTVLMLLTIGWFVSAPKPVRVATQFRSMRARATAASALPATAVSASVVEVE